MREKHELVAAILFVINDYPGAWNAPPTKRVRMSHYSLYQYFQQVFYP